jgi:hypothetical protein
VLRWRLSTWLLFGWTPLMLVWLAVQGTSRATCGPEIYRHCTVGVSVETGLGQSGILLLWLLGTLALAATWYTTRRGYLVFVALPNGYALRERRGALPAVGARISHAGRRLSVVKIGSSPLPDDSRLCAYLAPPG